MSRPKKATEEAQAREAIERLFQFMSECAENGFFGKVTVSFQNGKVADVKVERNFKVREL